MSFGLRDEDWVEPDEQPVSQCRDCDDWIGCACGCGWGWCRVNGDFTREDDGCR